MSRDLGHVADLVASAAEIRRYLSDVTQEQFLTDRMRQSAVLHQLTIVGEACRRVSAAFREAHPDVDWPNIIALRNKIVHDYDDINLDSVWTVVNNDLPQLVVTLEALVPSVRDGEEDAE